MKFNSAKDMFDSWCHESMNYDLPWTSLTWDEQRGWEQLFKKIGKWIDQETVIEESDDEYHIGYNQGYDEGYIDGLEGREEGRVL